MTAKKSEIPAYGMLPRNQDQVDASRKEIIFWEEGNPRCVVNLLQNARQFREAVMNIPPNYLGMSDAELETLVEPGAIDQELRLSFWDEYFVAIDNDAQIRLTSVYARTCTREYFRKFVMQDPKRLAYMMRPPREYMLRMRSLLELGMKRFEEIMALPLQETKVIRGNKVEIVNTKLIGEIVKIVALIDNRVKGAVVQKVQIDQTSKNLHMHGKYEAPKSHAEIEAELKSVQSEILALSTPQAQPMEEVLFNGIMDDERETIEVSASSSEEEGA